MPRLQEVKGVDEVASLFDVEAHIDRLVHDLMKEIS